VVAGRIFVAFDIKRLMREKGYETFPDGRSLDDVIDYLGSDKKWPP